MMTTLLLTFLFMLLIVTLMAVGVMFSRKPIGGSCGGLKALDMGVACEICGEKRQASPQGTETPTATSAVPYEDATKNAASQ
jgi:hypothetical protein